MNSSPEVWLQLLCPPATPAPLLFWSWDKQTLPIHHLTGSSQISGQSHRGLGAIGDKPQTASGFLTGPTSPRSPPPKPNMLLGCLSFRTCRSLSSRRPGAMTSLFTGRVLQNPGPATDLLLAKPTSSPRQEGSPLPQSLTHPSQSAAPTRRSPRQGP